MEDTYQTEVECGPNWKAKRFVLPMCTEIKSNHFSPKFLIVEINSFIVFIQNFSIEKFCHTSHRFGLKMKLDRVVLTRKAFVSMIIALSAMTCIFSFVFDVFFRCSFFVFFSSAAAFHLKQLQEKRKRTDIFLFGREERGRIQNRRLLQQKKLHLHQHFSNFLSDQG